MERPKRNIKKPKAIYEPDPDVKLEGDFSEDSDFDIDALSSGDEILTSDDEQSDSGSDYINSITKKDEYEKDDFLVSDNDSLGEISESGSEASWHTSDEEELSTTEEEVLPDETPHQESEDEPMDVDTN